MSSIYRVICLSHDPAISFGEHSRPEAAAAEIAEGLDDHPDCDLLIGRYSYPLVEVGCPPGMSNKRSGQRCGDWHSMVEWVDAGWLRLLAAVQHAGSPTMQALTDNHCMRHWPWERLWRLRHELGLELTEERT